MRESPCKQCPTSYIHTHTNIHTHTQTYIHTLTYIHTNTHIHTHKHTYTHTNIHTHKYTHTHSNPRRKVIPTQRGAKRVNEERVFIAAEVGFSGGLPFDVDGLTV